MLKKKVTLGESPSLYTTEDTSDRGTVTKENTISKNVVVIIIITSIIYFLK